VTRGLPGKPLAEPGDDARKAQGRNEGIKKENNLNTFSER